MNGSTIVPRMSGRCVGMPTIAAAGLLLAFLSAPAAAAVAISTERVSVSSSGGQANNGAERPAVSADGRFVAFTSFASNLVPNDTNNADDVFVRDRQNGTTELISVPMAGGVGNGSYAAISADGRFVAFLSSSPDMVPGDTNGIQDIFVRDRLAGTTERVSVATSGAQANSYSQDPSISADGRFVAFSSDASTLVPGDTNGKYDIFVRDRMLGVTTRESLSSSGAEPNESVLRTSISADGRFVVFDSSATNLVSPDLNGIHDDVFLRDRTAGTTVLVSQSSTGVQGNSASGNARISANGRYVVFVSDSSNLVPSDLNGSEDVFVRDLVAGTTVRASVSSAGAEGNKNSVLPSISSDGTRVAFSSSASNLIGTRDTNGTVDVFVRDLAQGFTVRVSVSTSGAQGNGPSLHPAISSGGTAVAYDSGATNLVPGDTNSQWDVFASVPA